MPFRFGARRSALLRSAVALAIIGAPVVRLVAIAGDSNAVGRGDNTRTGLDGDLAGVYQWCNNSATTGYQTFSSDITPLRHPDAIVSGTGDRIGPGEQIGRSLKGRYPNDIIVLVPCGMGGTSIATAGETWNPATAAQGGGSSDYTPVEYNTLKSSIAAARTAALTNWPGYSVVTEMVYWDGGMNDVSGSIAGTAFYTALKYIISQFRTDVPLWAGARWVCAGLPFDGAATLPSGPQIERAFINVVATTANVYYVKSIDDTPDDADPLHRIPAANRDMGTKAALVDADLTAPTWTATGVTYNNTTGRKLYIEFTDDVGIVGALTGTTVAVDSNFEVANVFSVIRVLRWAADGAKTLGTYDPDLTIIGGNRQTLNVPTIFNAVAVGSISPLASFTARPGVLGKVHNLNDLSTVFQDRAGTVPVTADGQVVGKVLDLSPNNNHWVADTDARRPTYKIDSDGKAYLLFDRLSGTSATSLRGAPFTLPANPSYTAVMGIYAAAQSAEKGIFCSTNAGGSAPIIPFEAQGANSNVGQWMGGAGPSLTGVLDSTKRVLTSRYSSAAPFSRRLRNAASRGSGGASDAYQIVNNTEVAPPVTTASSTLGSWASSTPTDFFNGRVYSHGVINADLFEPETANWEDWFGALTLTAALP